MQLLRYPALSAIILFCAAYAFAQGSTCTLKRAPELHGFQLGMAVPEARGNLTDPTVFDSAAPSAAGDSVGPRAVRISGSELKPENAEGVDDINLTFVDRRLALIKVTYNSAVRWDNAPDFFARVSEKLGLPKFSGSDSSRRSSGNERYKIECVGFTVTLAYSFGVSPSVTISDTAAQKTVDKRREKQEEDDATEIRITPSSRPRRPE